MPSIGGAEGIPVRITLCPHDALWTMACRRPINPRGSTQTGRSSGNSKHRSNHEFRRVEVNRRPVSAVWVRETDRVFVPGPQFFRRLHNAPVGSIHGWEGTFGSSTRIERTRRFAGASVTPGISSDRLYDRNFFLALASQTCFVTANTLMAHYARWIEFLGGDLRQVGFIMGSAALLSLVLRPWLGQYINRAGARAMWAVGYTLFAIMSIANLWLGEVSLMVYLVRSGLVLATAVVFASSLTYIAQTAPEYRRTEAIGVFGIGGFLGMLVGPLLGDLFLFERGGGNFAALFIVAAAANALPAIGLYFLRPTASEGTDSSVRLSNFLSTVRRHWPGMILLVDFAFGVCMSGPFIFVASFIDQASLRMRGVSEIGLFFWCYAGLGIFARLTLRKLPDRIGARKVLLAGMLFMSLGMFSLRWWMRRTRG